MRARCVNNGGHGHNGFFLKEKGWERGFGCVAGSVGERGTVYSQTGLQEG